MGKRDEYELPGGQNSMLEEIGLSAVWNGDWLFLGHVFPF